LKSSEAWKSGVWNVLAVDFKPGQPVEIRLKTVRIIREVRVEVESPYTPDEKIIYEEEVELR